MKIIVLVAVIGVVLVGAFGPTSGMDGVMAMGVVILAAMLAIGIQEAWSNKRGPLGWIVNIPASIIGGLIASQIADIVLVILLAIVPFEGALVASQNPLKFVWLAAMATSMLFGSWGTLQIINRWRDRKRSVEPVIHG